MTQYTERHPSPYTVTDCELQLIKAQRRLTDIDSKLDAIHRRHNAKVEKLETRIERLQEKLERMRDTMKKRGKWTEVKITKDQRIRDVEKANHQLLQHALELKEQLDFWQNIAEKLLSTGVVDKR
jgi:predicted  nucleic acid-binding Zn-ribbon protein